MAYHATTKTFKTLKEEGFIYQVNPFTQKVEGMKIQEMKGVTEKLLRGKHPTPMMYKHYIQVTYYMRDLQVHSADLSNVPTVTVIIDGRLEVQLVPCKIQGFDHLFPIPFSPNKQALEEYVKSGT